MVWVSGLPTEFDSVDDCYKRMTSLSRQMVWCAVMGFGSLYGTLQLAPVLLHPVDGPPANGDYFLLVVVLLWSLSCIAQALTSAWHLRKLSVALAAAETKHQRYRRAEPAVKQSWRSCT